MSSLTPWNESTIEGEGLNLRYHLVPFSDKWHALLRLPAARRPEDM